MKLVREYLEGACNAHDNADLNAPKGIRRWSCAPCLLEMLPRLRRAAEALCELCRHPRRWHLVPGGEQGPGRPGLYSHFYHTRCGRSDREQRHGCAAVEPLALLHEISRKLKGLES